VMAEPDLSEREIQESSNNIHKLNTAVQVLNNQNVKKDKRHKVTLDHLENTTSQQGLNFF
jgi:predicted house-cleaning NTP pyrophosphatase (Maf/HAM1 superfamily)